MMLYNKLNWKPSVRSICVLLLMISFSLHAQSEGPDTTKTTPISITVQPLFLFNNAGKMDLEIQPLRHQFSYVISAELYAGKVKDAGVFDNSMRLAADELNGFGVGLLQKYKFKKSTSSPYVSYGITYRHQEIAIETEGFSPYQDNGLTYYEYGPIQKRLLIDGLLVGATLGYQKISSHIVYDLYIGFGYKTPIGNLDFQGYRRYDQTMTSFAYKGLSMLIGFKVGIRL